MKKKITTLLLFVCYQLALYAQTWQSQGNYDISWYRNSDVEFTISSAKEIAGLAYLVNNGYANFTNKVIKLSEDIDLSNHLWIGIGNNRYTFKGTFDGQEHTIKGILITKESGFFPYYGFWTQLYKANIQNLNLSGKLLLDFPNGSYPENYIGSLTAYANNCQLDNCNSTFDITYSRNGTITETYEINLGGMIGISNNSVIQHCSHKGDINVSFGKTGTNSETYDSHSSILLGGIIGNADNTSLKYCINQSELIKLDAAGSKNADQLPTNIGGIAGSTDDNTELIACSNHTESIEATFRGTKGASLTIGGIAAYAYYYPASKGNLVNCYSSTNEIHITAPNSRESYIECGGIAGSYNSNSIEKYIANFSPSDSYVWSLTSINLHEGYAGSASYSKSEMTSPDFLSELNLYPNINQEEYQWVLCDKQFPIIKTDKEPTSLPASHAPNSTSDFKLANGHIIFPTPIYMQIYTISGMPVYSGFSQISQQLNQGYYILKVRNDTHTIYVE